MRECRVAHFDDLEPCTAFPGEWKNLLAVGWLAKGHEYKRGPVDLELMERILRMGWMPPNAPRGSHRCDLCLEGELARSESGAIFVPGTGVLYVAPRLIRHYVQKHGYQPPALFLEAARTRPLFGEEYEAAISRHFVRPVQSRPAPGAYDAAGIEVLEGLEPVRMRPGMYFGSTGVQALGELLYEIVGNSLDEYLAGAATRISIDVDGRGWVTVEDDGRGIPAGTPAGISAFEASFTSLHSGATFDGHHPHVHIRTSHIGVGVAAANALCARMEVETRRDGMAYRAAFECGRIVEPLHPIGETTQRGTVIRYLPDDEIFEVGALLDLDATEKHLTILARLCPKLDLRLQGRSLQQLDGMPGWIRELAPEVVRETVLFAAGTVQDVEVEVALAWRPGGSGPMIRSFVNYLRTVEAGSHEKGLLTALEELIGQKRAARKKVVLSGLVAIVHVGMLHPRFGGPTRSRLEFEAARLAVHEVVTRALNEAPWWWDRLHEKIG